MTAGSITTRVLLFATAVLIALGAAEVGLRIVGFESPRFFVPDDAVGQWHRPYAEGWQAQEGRAYVRINADGLRDREHTTTKPRNTYRIAILGDSVPEAFQLPMEKAFWAILERKLSDCSNFAGKTVEAINFGVGDFGTAQELVTLERRVWSYAPDMVLVAFAANDVRNNSRAIEWQRVRPFFALQANQLVLDDSFARSAHVAVRDSRFWRVMLNVSDHVRVLQLGMRIRQLMSARAAIARREVDESVDDNEYRAPRTPEWSDAWAITEALLRRMRDESRAHGARFVLVTVTDGRQVDPSRAVREQTAKRLGVADLFYPERRLTQFGSRDGIEVVTLAQRMQAYADAHHVYLHGYFNDPPGKGHWNENGHGVAADLIRDYLCTGR